MTDPQSVGLVAGTGDSTPLEFSVGLAEGQYLQLDDVVVTHRSVPGVGMVTTSESRQVLSNPRVVRAASASNARS